MRVMKNFKALVLTLVLVLSVSFVSKAAPYVNNDGTIVDDSLPAGFIDGYVYANHATYNSSAEENGLGGTYVWFEGTFNSLEKVESTYTLTSAVVTDLDGNQWLVVLDAEMWTADDTFIDNYNKPLAIAGRYEGFSNVYQLPTVFCTKICDISTNDIWTSVLGTNAYDDVPAAASTSGDTSNAMGTAASMISGRYYYTENLSTYRPYVFVDVVANADGSLIYNLSTAGITTSNKVAQLYSADEDLLYYYDGTNVLGFAGSLLMIEYPTGTVYMYVKL